jgi:hypothetical protein
MTPHTDVTVVNVLLFLFEADREGKFKSGKVVRAK